MVDDILLVGGGVAIAAFALYELFSGGSTSQGSSPSMSTRASSSSSSSTPSTSSTNPFTSSSVNPSSTGGSPSSTINPSNISGTSQRASGFSNSSYYAINYSPQSTDVSTYSPYTYRSSSNTYAPNTSNTYSSTSSNSTTSSTTNTANNQKTNEVMQHTLLGPNIAGSINNCTLLARLLGKC